MLSWAVMVRRLLIWLLLLLPALGWASGVEELQQALRRAAQRAVPAVVNIATLKVYREVPSPLWQDPLFREFFGEDFFRFFGIPRERIERSLGSGVLVSPDGYILTNYHVIAKAARVVVGLKDGREFEARIVGVDPPTDLALLKVEAKGLPCLPFGNSDETQVGDIVLAIGNPFGIGQTVTMGIVSAKGRSNMGLVEYEDFIQTDAAINPGNSGGALINLQGELIGINSAIVSRTGGYQGIGFAIPSNIARWVMAELIWHGRVIRGWFGVTVQELNPELAAHLGLKEPQGALVVEVYPLSPAQRAGLKRGDVILEYDGRKIREAWELRNLVATTPVGKEVTLVVLREGKRKELRVKIVEPPPS